MKAAAVLPSGGASAGMKFKKKLSPKKTKMAPRRSPAKEVTFLHIMGLVWSGCGRFTLREVF